MLSLYIYLQCTSLSSQFYLSLYNCFTLVALLVGRIYISIPCIFILSYGFLKLCSDMLWTLFKDPRKVSNTNIYFLSRNLCDVYKEVKSPLKMFKDVTGKWSKNTYSDCLMKSLLTLVPYSLSAIILPA